MALWCGRSGPTYGVAEPLAASPVDSLASAVVRRSIAVCQASLGTLSSRLGRRGPVPRRRSTISQALPGVKRLRELRAAGVEPVDARARAPMGARQRERQREENAWNAAHPERPDSECSVAMCSPRSKTFPSRSLRGGPGFRLPIAPGSAEESGCRTLDGGRRWFPNRRITPEPAMAHSTLEVTAVLLMRRRHPEEEVSPYNPGSSWPLRYPRQMRLGSSERSPRHPKQCRS
jgi:hypothetical protein